MLNKCCRVTAKSFMEPWLIDTASELDETLKMHRKLWEYAVIARVYRERVGSGGRCLGFGVGAEPIASWLAAQGAQVTATDKPDDKRGLWTDTGQYAVSLDTVYNPGVVAREDFDRRVEFFPVDMRHLPEDLLAGEYDFTWSSGVFEHLGGLEPGLAFFCRQMEALRPGGIAAHTTEFNYESNDKTLSTGDVVLYREKDFESLAERIAAQGDSMWPMDFSRGNEPEDLFVDSPPYATFDSLDDVHLHLTVGGWPTTSVLLVATRGEAAP